MSQDADFDDLIERLGGFGKYQKRLLYLLLGPLFFIMPFPLMHQVFVLHVPEHSCSLPAEMDMEALGFNNLSTYQEVMLPKELNAYYQMTTSACNYLQFSPQKIEEVRSKSGELENYSAEELQSFVANFQEGVNKTACTAWEYDTSEFYDTAVTEENWVCEKQIYTADLYTLTTVGLLLGTFIFSAIADFFGRKTSFYVGCACVIVFSLCMLPVSYSFTLFALFQALSAFGMMPIFQSPLSILCEISNIEKRSYVLCYSCITWSIGQIVFPLVGYLIASWKIIKAVSVLPLTFFFLTWKLLPESPRWLVIKGKKDEAMKILNDIAKTNSVVAPVDMDSRVQKMVEATQEKSLGYLSLFTTKQMALRTVCMTFGFTASAFVYYQMVINVSNMTGSPFLNLFFLGLVEGPGNFWGVFLANKMGRRWCHSTLLLINAILFAAIMPLAHYSQDASVSMAITVMCMIIKFNIAATFIVAYIQALEIFPTCVRQSGVGLCSTISQIISIGGPYVIFLGQTNLMFPYMVMALICFVGAVATTFLPETIDCKLPETIEEAVRFGKHDAYFSYKPTRYEAPMEQEKSAA